MAINTKQMARWAVQRGFVFKAQFGGYVAIYATANPTAVRRGLAQLPRGARLEVVGFVGKLVVEKTAKNRFNVVSV